MSGEHQHILNAGVGFINLSPHGFRKWAPQYLQCRHDFRMPAGFTPVPYFLVCRAIELELKARHLEARRQPEVKRDFGHDLIKSYNALAEDQKTLSAEELDHLTKANAVYVDKGFEYFSVQDAVTAFRRFPDLASLDAIGRRLVGN